MTYATIGAGLEVSWRDTSDRSTQAGVARLTSTARHYARDQGAHNFVLRTLGYAAHRQDFRVGGFRFARLFGAEALAGAKVGRRA